jgi:hypothetical protein
MTYGTRLTKNNKKKITCHKPLHKRNPPTNKDDSGPQKGRIDPSTYMKILQKRMLEFQTPATQG